MFTCMEWKRALEQDKSTIPTFGYKESKRGERTQNGKINYTGNVLMISSLTYKRREEEEGRDKEERRTSKVTEQHYNVNTQILTAS